MKFDWNPDNIEKLRTMIAAKMSPRQAAAELGGVSRNSVLGKAHRLGLRFGSRGAKNVVRPARKRAPSVKTQARQQPRLVFMPAPALKAPAIPAVPDPAPVSASYDPKRLLLFDLPFFGACKFPLFTGTDPVSERFYCGLPTSDQGGSWCEHCAKIVFTPTKKFARTA